MKKGLFRKGTQIRSFLSRLPHLHKTGISLAAVTAISLIISFLHFLPSYAASLDFVQSGSEFVSGGTQFTITLDSAPTDGNLLLMGLSISQYGNSRTPTPPAGWSLVDTLEDNYSSLWVYQKVADSDGTTYVVNVSGSSEYHSGVIAEYEDAVLVDSDIENSYSTPSLSPTNEGMRAISFLATDGGSINAVGTGWTIKETVSNGWYHDVATAEKNVLTSGSTAVNT